MKNLEYLASAYTAIWLILAYFITTLLLKNRRLARQIEDLKERMAHLEKRP